MDIWIVILEDRHTDTEAFPFSTEELAVAEAKALARSNAWSEDDIEWDEGLNEAMIADNWVLYIPYSCEDSVRVVKRTLDA